MALPAITNEFVVRFYCMGELPISTQQVRTLAQAHQLAETFCATNAYGTAIVQHMETLVVHVIEAGIGIRRVRP